MLQVSAPSGGSGGITCLTFMTQWWSFSIAYRTQDARFFSEISPKV
jgi:hypothetical protein